MNNLIEFCRFTLYTPTNTMLYFWPNFDFIDGVSRKQEVDCYAHTFAILRYFINKKNEKKT